MRPTPTALGLECCPLLDTDGPHPLCLDGTFKLETSQLSSCLAHLTSLMGEEALSIDLGKYAHQHQDLLDPVLRTWGFSEKLCPHIKALAFINSGLWKNLGRAMVK